MGTLLASRRPRPGGGGLVSAVFTPPILGADGRPVPGSIATMEKVRLGGVNHRLMYLPAPADH